MEQSKIIYTLETYQPQQMNQTLTKHHIAELNQELNITFAELNQTVN